MRFSSRSLVRMIYLLVRVSVLIIRFICGGVVLFGSWVSTNR